MKLEKQFLRNLMFQFPTKRLKNLVKRRKKQKLNQIMIIFQVIMSLMYEWIKLNGKMEI